MADNETANDALQAAIDARANAEDAREQAIEMLEMERQDNLAQAIERTREQMAEQAAQVPPPEPNDPFRVLDQVMADREAQRILTPRPVLHQRPVEAQPVAVEPHPDTVGIKLTAEVLLGRSLLDLLKQAPNNPTIRTMISKHCRKTVPVELVGVDEIIAWIEANVTLPPPVINETRRGPQPVPMAPGMFNVDPAARTVRDVDYVMTVHAVNRGTESGTARWSGNYREDREVRVSRDTFQRFVREADDFDELMELIRDHATQELSDNGGDWESTGRDYEDHETLDSDCDDSSIDNRNAVADLSTRLLVQMRDRIEDPEEREAFEARFGL